MRSAQIKFSKDVQKMRRNKDHFRGCLIGGAIGDALGWPVEFLSKDEIKNHYGEAGITDLVIGSSGKAEITDDTQMTIFTAEGLLRANTRYSYKGICHGPSVVYRAYLRWLHTHRDILSKDHLLTRYTMAG